MSAAFDTLANDFATRLAGDLVESGPLCDYMKELFLHFHEDGAKKDTVLALCLALYPDIHAQYLLDL